MTYFESEYDRHRVFVEFAEIIAENFDMPDPYEEISPE